jgi:Flp pilus assembly protein TadG
MRNGRSLATALRRRLGRARQDGERGAVLVEAVIVIPILMLITLGIIEYGSAYQQDAAVASASRAGARVASAMTTKDFGVTANATDAGIITANAVAAALQSVGSATPKQMWIYRIEPSNSACGPPSFTSCAYKVGYAWNSTTKLFNTAELSGSGSWPATKQFACASTVNPNGGGTGPDQIGIWVSMTHTAVTHLFGGDKTLTGQTIMRLEPNVDSTCGVS